VRPGPAVRADKVVVIPEGIAVVASRRAWERGVAPGARPSFRNDERAPLRNSGGIAGAARRGPGIRVDPGLRHPLAAFCLSCEGDATSR